MHSPVKCSFHSGRNGLTCGMQCSAIESEVETPARYAQLKSKSSGKGVR